MMKHYCEIMSCIICNSKKTRVVRDTLRFGIKRKVLRCSRCSLEYLEPLTTVSRAYYQSKKYRKTHGPTLGKTSTPRDVFTAYFPYQKEIIKELAPVLKRRMSVLDVGCSTGHFLAALKGKVKNRVGLEPSCNEAAFIRRNLDFKVYEEPVETAKIPEGPFDLVTTIETLEHINDPLSFLSGIKKNLKPNGYLYIEVPNLNDALLSVYRAAGYADFYYREPHVFYFSPKTLSALLKKAGFVGQIKTVQRYNILNHLHWIFTGEPQKAFSTAAGAPLLLSGKDKRKNVGQALNMLIQDTDTKYKKILAAHSAGDLVTFLGRQI